MKPRMRLSNWFTNGRHGSMNLDFNLIWQKCNTWNAASKQMVQWCQVTNVLYIWKILLFLKLKIYHIVVHPVALYGAEW
ncbi:hypothetical protein L345_06908, partial [Ophiophagus hannah]